MAGGSFSLSALGHVIHQGSQEVRRKIWRLYAFLIVLNVGAWVLAFIAFSKHPVLLGTALLAYTFGLRHAVDADHISAIDNVTRKLMQERKRPVGVGFFFSLGHSTIVVGLTVAIAVAASVVKTRIPSLQSVGGLVGTSVSAAFLLIIALINLIVLLDIFRTFRDVQRGEIYNDQSLDQMLNQRGLIGRFFRPLLKIVDTSWKMYPIGVLFGLGFDTATEVGLLGIAAVEAGKGLPVVAILIFPLLFTAGMSLLDTTDGILMLGAYGWAFLKPMRKLYYNMVITLVSVLVALVVGGIEALSIVSGQLKLHGGLWDAVGSLSDHFGTLGFIIVGIFIASWIISTIIYRIKRYDDLDIPIAPAVAAAIVESS
ncbi:MAG: HoxN/HupN/NixA family nickel/cobalt transporter [Candidatus Eremiobacteraeota bacterium]|nr:HoxN/HupN/NixA family nickel/cobalt transporter [Candidatus Eremiobacteraeota bacterium]